MDVPPPTTRLPRRPRRWSAPLLLLLLVLGVGCARLPRIDPTGERVLIFPGQQPPAAALPGQTIPGLARPGVFTQPPSNVTAPPAFAQGQSPGLLGLGVLGEGGAIDRALGGPTVIGPAVGQPQLGTPVAAPPVGPAPTTGPLRSRLAGCDLLNERVSGDRVVITPQRVLAPVGTEVIVRAGVCGEDGFLRCNRRIDWLLAEQGAGQFVQVGEEGELDLGRLPWRTPKKLDNHYAVGYTSPFHTCLRRGNADPLDDIQVRKGDAWITVSSASEGASFVTAAAKSVNNWDTRRASTVIHWVDAQWQFPPSTSVAAGTPHTLTTTVTRQTDGTPIEGWIVRYAVRDPGAARLGYDAGEASEVRTDSQGRASVELTPTDAAAGSTTVDITVIRPQQPEPNRSPRIDVGRGAATINWTGAATVAAPSPVLPPINPTPPAPATPDFQPPGTPPPAPPQPAGRPQLEVMLRQLTSDPVKEGDLVQFEVLVQNRGTAPARNIVIRDRFDTGLSHAGDTQGRNEIETGAMRDLGPGESDRLQLEFDVLQPGRRTHQATVSADGPPGQPRVEAFDQAMFTAVPLQPTAPTLDVRFERPTPVSATVGGDPVDFVAVVENVGSVAAENLVVTLKLDARLLRVVDRTPHRPDLGENFRALTEGTMQVLELTIPRLDPGQRTRKLLYRCVPEQPTLTNTRLTIEATTPAGGDAIDEAFIEVRPAAPGTGPPGGGALGGSPFGGSAPGGAAASAAPLRVDISETANAVVGRPLQINVIVTNDGPTTLRNVQVQTFLPPAQFRPQPNGVLPLGFTPFEDGTLRFPPIAELPPSQQTTVLMTVEAVGQGVGVVSASARSDAYPVGVTKTRSIPVSPR